VAARVLDLVGERLRRGDLIITGLIVQIPVAPGDLVEAQIAELGSVQLDQRAVEHSDDRRRGLGCALHVCPSRPASAAGDDRGLTVTLPADSLRPFLIEPRALLREG
jgi:hypothetical protein